MMGYLQRPDAGVVDAKLYFADHLVQHAGIVVGVRGALSDMVNHFWNHRLCLSFPNLEQLAQGTAPQFSPMTDS